jgi:hypothetical protein
MKKNLLVLLIFVVASTNAFTALIPPASIDYFPGSNLIEFDGSLVKSITADSINVALIANTSTSFVSGWEDLDAVNDGFTPANSNDKSHGAYGNWPNPNSLQWVQYEWTSNYILSSAEIYWFDDNGGILTPTIAYLEYFMDGEWVRSADVPCEKNTFNKANIGGVLTNKLRLSMQNPDQSTGILEFRVWGTNATGGTDIEAPSIPGTPEILNSTGSSLTVTWGSSTDNVELTEYQLLKNDTLLMSSTDTTAVIEGISENETFLLSVRAVDASGNMSAPGGSIWVNSGTYEQTSTPYTWPVYSPTLNYNFKDEFPDISEPTMELDDCPQVVGSQSSGWWTFKWGPNKRSLVTEAAITPMLERFNEDFAYFRDSLGWPPDKRAKEGYRSTIYLFGSGLSCIDNADSTALGGWQSSVGGYACVLASYYPVYSFDPSCPYSDREFQMGAMIHEGIHSILADLPGCKKAAWFHEGGNTWLQQEAEARKANDYSSMGFLNAGAFIAPFMPIECYSGWLQDGSFGGPSAEGVNMYNSNGTQLCTWRNLLGGHQYGNSFPTFLGTVLGKGSVAWIWRNCPERVLEGMAAGLGDMQMRRLLTEYRAKQALVDMKEWSGAVKKLLDANFKSTIRSEFAPSWIAATSWTATPYVKTWMLDSVNRELTPEPRTTPGWSGANQIPLNVSGDTVEINFIPLGENLTLQICYRATDGTPVYSKPVSSGSCKLALDKAPANGVVIAVITNTNYVYKGEETRKAHFDYRIRLVRGITEKASVYKRWYDYESVITDEPDPVEPFPTEGPLYVEPVEPPVEPIDTTSVSFETVSPQVTLFPNPVSGNSVLNIEYSEMADEEKEIQIFNLHGQLLYSEKNINSRSTVQISDQFKRGVYFLSVQTTGGSGRYKFIVN